MSDYVPKSFLHANKNVGNQTQKLIQVFSFKSAVVFIFEHAYRLTLVNDIAMDFPGFCMETSYTASSRFPKLEPELGQPRFHPLGDMAGRGLATIVP